MKKLLPLILILFAIPCFAKDGSELLRKCDHKDDGSATYFVSISACEGYIYGAADAYDSASEICIEGIEYEQMRKVVVKFLRVNPELLDYQAASLVRAALQKAFPCK